MDYTIQDQDANIVKEQQPQPQPQQQQQPYEKVNFYFYYGDHVLYSVKIPDTHVPNTHVPDTHVLDTHQPDTHQPDTITTRIPLFDTMLDTVSNVMRMLNKYICKG